MKSLKKQVFEWKASLQGTHPLHSQGRERGRLSNWKPCPKTRHSETCHARTTECWRTCERTMTSSWKPYCMATWSFAHRGTSFRCTKTPCFCEIRYLSERIEFPISETKLVARTCCTRLITNNVSRKEKRREST